MLIISKGFLGKEWSRWFASFTALKEPFSMRRNWKRTVSTLKNLWGLKGLALKAMIIFFIYWTWLIASVIGAAIREGSRKAFYKVSNYMVVYVGKIRPIVIMRYILKYIGTNPGRTELASKLQIWFCIKVLCIMQLKDYSFGYLYKNSSRFRFIMNQ